MVQGIQMVGKAGHLQAWEAGREQPPATRKRKELENQEAEKEKGENSAKQGAGGSATPAQEGLWLCRYKATWRRSQS